VADAKVIIHNQTGIQRETTTNESGFNTVTNLPPGLYTISVQAPGFQKYQSNDNKLEPSGHLGIDVPLAVGSSNETVEVTANTVALQTESATVQKLVTREQIDALELNGRNPVLMSNLVPGTRGGNLAGLSFNFSQGPANFNGSRNPENLITYDGAPATRTRSNGTSLGSADVDSTEEIQILTANYSPEYGRTSGGQVRIITRTGTQITGASGVTVQLRNADGDVVATTRTEQRGQFSFNQLSGPAASPTITPGVSAIGIYSVSLVLPRGTKQVTANPGGILISRGGRHVNGVNFVLASMHDAPSGPRRR